MSSVEKMFFDYENAHKGALIVEIPMLPPIPATQMEMAELLVEAGVDVIQIPTPIRFPWMYGNRIMTIQNMAAKQNIYAKQSFEVLAQLVERFPQTEFMPVGFYGGLQRIGQDTYISRCKELGIRLADVPDYPLVHDDDPKGLYQQLKQNGIDYVTVISTQLAMQPEGSRGYARLQKLISLSYGFCFLLAAAGGKTGEKESFNYDELEKARQRILSVQEQVGRRCPIVAVCGISTPEQVHRLVKDHHMHVMFGSALFTRMMNGTGKREIYNFIVDMKKATN